METGVIDREPMPVDHDFLASQDGLQLALSLLLEHHGAAAEPHPKRSDLDLPTALPDEGIGGPDALRTLAGSFFPAAARLGHPGYFAHMDPPTPWMSWAGALWAAACNQNLLHTDTGAGARELEHRVVRWLAPYFGMGGGHLVPGSTVGNLTALWAARELRGVRTVVASELAHLSIRKAASLLGLTLREVPADDGHRLRPEALEDLDLGRAAVVLTAGTVAAGAIDPLDAFADAAWRHVDAAWAGPLRLTRHASLLDGVEHADSVSVSAHKWLFQPKESAIILFRDAARAHQVLTFGGGYLAAPNVGLLGSHGAAALPLAATVLAWGRRGIAERIERCIRLAEALAERVAHEPELELFRRPVTGVVLWRLRGADPRAVRERMRDAFVSTTDVRGQTWLRSVAANSQADPDRVVDSVLRGREARE